MSTLEVRAALARGDFRLDVEFASEPGEVLAVLGPNGAGKSTLLRALAGLAALDDGKIALGGRVLDDPSRGVFVDAPRRSVGLVFQDHRLFPHLSVTENVAFAPRTSGIRRRAARREADRWLDRLGLGGLGDRKPGQLSGGQAQRVALARALAAEPDLLLLDEPLAALDAETRSEVRAELRRHLGDFAGPAVLVTHDPLEAWVLADRLIVLDGGAVAQSGTPAEVARRPANEYVARLAGLNFYRGERTGGEIALDGGGTLRVPPSSGPSGRVLVALRPSAITLHTRKPDHLSSRNLWSGRVAGVEPLTDRVRVQVDGAPAAIVELTLGAVAELGLGAGTPVWLSVKATDLDVYRS